MNNIGLIIKREYLRRVSKKSFLLLTLLMPFLFAALIFVPLLLAQLKGNEIHNIAVLDSTGNYVKLFEDADNYHFIGTDRSLESYKKNPDKQIFAFVSITDDLLKNPSAAVIYSEKQVPGDLSRLVNGILTEKIQKDKLSSFNIPNIQQIIDESKVDFSIRTVKWNEDGSEKATSSTASSIAGLAFTVIIYMFILIYGSMVMQGVMEEKSNRIVEVMISSVRPFDLMIGKIIGIGLVGITQLFIWGIMTTALIFASGFLMGGGTDFGSIMAGMNSSPDVMNAAQAQMAQAPGNEFYSGLMSINFKELAICFILYFIGGYLLYSSIFAAVGAAVDNQEDTSQFMIPITVLMAFALYAGLYSADNPDGPLAFWCSLFPFTAPIVMMIRVPFDAPIWQHIISLVLLYGSAIGMVMLSGKIYRVGILMYGKKPSLKEIVKWIQFK